MLVRLKLSQVAFVVSATVSEEMSADVLDPLRTDRTAVTAAFDCAITEFGLMVLPAIGVTTRGTATVTSVESDFESALSADAVAVFVIVEPSVAFEFGSSRTCRTAVRVDPARMPLELGGFGGEGSASV